MAPGFAQVGCARPLTAACQLSYWLRDDATASWWWDVETDESGIALRTLALAC